MTGSHRRDPGRHPDPERPTPREIKALKAVQHGAPLAVAAKQLGITRQQLGHILSHAYDRLKVKDMGQHHLSKERRSMAIDVCIRNGWWPENDQSS